MPENQRAPRPDVVDVFVAVHVPKPRALAACDEWGVAFNGLEGAHRRAHAAGNYLFGALLQASGFVKLACHDFSTTTATAFTGHCGRDARPSTVGSVHCKCEREFINIAAGTFRTWYSEVQHVSSTFHGSYIMLQYAIGILASVRPF